MRQILDLDSDIFRCFNHRDELDSAVQLPNFRSVGYGTLLYGVLYIVQAFKASFIYPWDCVSQETCEVRPAVLIRGWSYSSQQIQYSLDTDTRYLQPHRIPKKLPHNYNYTTGFIIDYTIYNYLVTTENCCWGYINCACMNSYKSWISYNII